MHRAISSLLTIASMRLKPMVRPRTTISVRWWCALSPTRYKTVLMDTWYAGADNLKLIHRLGLIFFTTLKENRLVSLSPEEGYIHLDQIDWTPERWHNGVLVKLKEVPFKVRLFKLVATNGDVDWVITNCPDETLTASFGGRTQDANDVRWQVEELHRGIKQLTGSEKCQSFHGRTLPAQSSGLLLSCLALVQGESPADGQNALPSQNGFVARLPAG